MIYKLIDDFWKLPAIVKGIREKVWRDPYKYPHLTKLWVDEGLLTKGNPVLTDAGEDLVKCQGLLEYELAMVQDQVNYDKLKTLPKNYDLLRSGLGSYFNTKLRKSWLDVISKLGVTDGWDVLDYGGGSGDYIKAFKEDYPNNWCCLADRPTCDFEYNAIDHIPIDFRKDPDWHKHHTESFSLIFLNEVLHLGEDLHDYLLRSSWGMLKPGGYLVIGEQIPTARFDWRMSAMTNNGNSLSVDQVENLAHMNGLKFYSTQYVSDSHYFMVLRK